MNCPLCNCPDRHPSRPVESDFIECAVCKLTVTREHWSALSALRVQRDDDKKLLGELLGILSKQLITSEGAVEVLERIIRERDEARQAAMSAEAALERERVTAKARDEHNIDQCHIARFQRDEKERAVQEGLSAIESMRAYAARLEVQRDEAVAELKTMTELAQKAVGEFGALAVAHAKQANERATGAPEVELTNAEQCARREDSELRALGATPAAPPVAGDAEALVENLVLAIASNLLGREAEWKEGVDAARAAVLARMPPVTPVEDAEAESLMNDVIEAWVGEHATYEEKVAHRKSAGDALLARMRPWPTAVVTRACDSLELRCEYIQNMCKDTREMRLEAEAMLAIVAQLRAALAALARGGA